MPEQAADPSKPERLSEPLDPQEALSWRGFRLDGMDGEGIGRVDGVYVDAASGKAEWLQVRIGRFGHRALVPARDAVAAVERVWVPYSRDAIRSSPRVKPGREITAGQERELLAHHGITAAGGRAGELDGREEGAASAVPAA